MAEFFGPRDQGAVARHLAVLDRLSVRYNRNVEYGLVSDLARCLIDMAVAILARTAKGERDPKALKMAAVSVLSDSSHYSHDICENRRAV
jgi:hypothetical protein